ncbi:MAG: hypothetical protein CL610_22700 [Anaerolineaceae bacterium]|nr:hypothetical protein [Anaerolineaceae bacterium]
MASERIGDMTKADLRSWIVEVIHEELKREHETSDHRTPLEVFESMRKNILKKRPDQPSVVDMLREDRDR